MEDARKWRAEGDPFVASETGLIIDTFLGSFVLIQ